MSKFLSGLFLFSLLFVTVPRSLAHCDSMGGPVILDARVALKQGDVTPTLKWVRQADEAELRGVFEKVIALRGKGKETREIGEQFFFETLVRLHRASEGAPYTGLKPEALAHDPVIEGVDNALQGGDSKRLIDTTTNHIRLELTEKYERAVSARKRANESVEAGRDYVRAYVELVHYVEKLHGGHSEKESAQVAAHQHE